MRAAGIVAVIALGLILANVRPALSRSTLFALFIVGLKIVADVLGHVGERRRFRRSSATEARLLTT